MSTMSSGRWVVGLNRKHECVIKAWLAGCCCASLSTMSSGRECLNTTMRNDKRTCASTSTMSSGRYVSGPVWVWLWCKQSEEKELGRQSKVSKQGREKEMQSYRATEKAFIGDPVIHWCSVIHWTVGIITCFILLQHFSHSASSNFYLNDHTHRSCAHTALLSLQFQQQKVCIPCSSLIATQSLHYQH